MNLERGPYKKAGIYKGIGLKHANEWETGMILRPFIYSIQIQSLSIILKTLGRGWELRAGEICRCDLGKAKIIMHTYELLHAYHHNVMFLIEQI